MEDKKDSLFENYNTICESADLIRFIAGMERIVFKNIFLNSSNEETERSFSRDIIKICDKYRCGDN